MEQGPAPPALTNTAQEHPPAPIDAALPTPTEAARQRMRAERTAERRAFQRELVRIQSMAASTERATARLEQRIVGHRKHVGHRKQSALRSSRVSTNSAHLGKVTMVHSASACTRPSVIGCIASSPSQPVLIVGSGGGKPAERIMGGMTPAHRLAPTAFLAERPLGAGGLLRTSMWRPPPGMPIEYRPARSHARLDPTTARRTPAAA